MIEIFFCKYMDTGGSGARLGRIPFLLWTSSIVLNALMSFLYMLLLFSSWCAGTNFINYCSSILSTFPKLFLCQSSSLSLLGIIFSRVTVFKLGQFSRSITSTACDTCVPSKFSKVKVSDFIHDTPAIHKRKFCKKVFFLHERHFTLSYKSFILLIRLIS